MQSLQSAADAVTPPSRRPLVFVDLETTGFDTRRDRIVEIGLVSVDAHGVSEWTTLLDPGRRWRRDMPAFADLPRDALADAPRFREIAAELLGRLAGRVFVAHNARFDFRFLEAEFARLGIVFETQAICTLALARRLEPHAGAHHLDALLAAHGLVAETRHRALPDARALWRYWRTVARETPAALDAAIEVELTVYAGAPPACEALCAELPEGRGVYALLDAAGRPLAIRSARRLRAEASRLVAALAGRNGHAPHALRWQRVAGPLEAALVRLELARTYSPACAAADAGVFLRVRPEGDGPLVEWLPAARGWPAGERCFGVYATPRRARNALVRLAAAHGLCTAALGIARGAGPCPGCGPAPCASGAAARLRTLAKLAAVTAPLRLPAWPYEGPIGVREGRVVHVFSTWRHLGTAQDADELEALARADAAPFDRAVFALLVSRLTKCRPHAVVALRAVGARVGPEVAEKSKAIEAGQPQSPGIAI